MGIIVSTFQRVSFALILLILFSGCVRQNTLPPIIPIDLGSDGNIGADSNTSFLDLNDTANSYVGAASNFVKVNSAATGLEFVNVAGVTDNCSGNQDCNILNDANIAGDLNVFADVDINGTLDINSSSTLGFRTNSGATIKNGLFVGLGSSLGTTPRQFGEIMRIAEEYATSGWTTAFLLDPFINADLAGATITIGKFAPTFFTGLDATATSVVRFISFGPTVSMSPIPAMTGGKITLIGIDQQWNLSTTGNLPPWTEAVGYKINGLQLTGANDQFQRAIGFQCIGTFDGNKNYCIAGNQNFQIGPTGRLLLGGSTTGAATGTANNTDGNASIASCTTAINTNQGKCIEIAYKSADNPLSSSVYVAHYRISDTNLSPVFDNNVDFGNTLRRWKNGFIWNVDSNRLTADTNLQVKAGTSNQYAEAGGTIDWNVDSKGNSAATDTNLYVHSLLANTLDKNGESIAIKAAGTFGSGVSVDKRVRVYFGGTTVFDSGGLNVQSVEWNLVGTIIRTSTTTQKASFNLTTSSGTLSAYSDYSTPAETLSGSVPLRLTGSGTNASDVVGEFWKISWEAS